LSRTLKKLMGLSPCHLMIGLTVIGVLITMQVNYIQHGWINNDSVLYFESARLFAAGEWQQGFKLFPWPLYSGLIALVHSITGWSLHFSAQCLNVAFFGIASYAFLQLIRLSGGDNLTLVAGALLLYSAQYITGDALQMLLRDQGFWAFFLTGIVFFVRFYRSLSWQDAIGWQVAMIIAMLFRVEGITYLAALPLVLLTKPELNLKARLQCVFRAHSLNLALASSIGMYIAVTGMPVSQLGRLKEIFTSDIILEVTKKFLRKTDIMADKVLGNFLDEFAIEGLLLTFLFIMIAKTISTTGWLAICLAAFAAKWRDQVFAADAKRILFTIALIAAINMLLIILKVFVLSGRYVIPLALIVMVLAAFGLAKLWHERANLSKKWCWLPVAITILLSLGILKNVLPKADGYNYQQEAVSWLNTRTSGEQKIFYDSSRVRYYAGEPFVGTWKDIWQKVTEATESGSIHEHEFLLISLERDETWKEAYIAEHLSSYKEVYRASNPKGKKFLVVYQRQAS